MGFDSIIGAIIDQQIDHTSLRVRKQLLDHYNLTMWKQFTIIIYLLVSVIYLTSGAPATEITATRDQLNDFYKDQPHLRPTPQVVSNDTSKQNLSDTPSKPQTPETEGPQLITNVHFPMSSQEAIAVMAEVASFLALMQQFSTLPVPGMLDQFNTFLQTLGTLSQTRPNVNGTIKYKSD